MQPRDSVHGWRRLTRTTLQALTLWDKAPNNVASQTRDGTTKVLWLPLWNGKQRWADKQRTTRWTWSRIDVLLSLKCACCLLFSPASPARTSLQPQWYLQAIHLTGADHYAVDRQLYAGGRWDCLYYNYRLLLFSFFIVSFSWASIMLKPVTVMVEPPSLLDSARSAQSCSFNKIHPGKEWLSRAPILVFNPQTTKNQ